MKCNDKCDECKICDFCGYSVDTLGYAEFSRLVAEHDAKVRSDVIDEFERILDKFYHKKINPKSEFRPAIVLTERDAENIIKQLKEKK